MRYPTALTLTLAAAVAGPAVALAAAGHNVDIPKKFRTQIPKVAKKTGISVRLPSTVRVFVKRTYADSVATRKSYTLDLGAARGCRGANACFIASFSGTRGAKPAFKRTVQLTGGVTGYFKPVTCGASCTPAFIQWKEGHVLYEIEYKGASEKKERSTMIALANSAIRGGER